MTTTNTFMTVFCMMMSIVGFAVYISIINHCGFRRAFNIFKEHIIGHIIILSMFTFVFIFCLCYLI
jgi:hypothetical protein